MLDGHLPRSTIVFVRTAIASIEIVMIIVWATPVFLAVIGPLAALYTYALVCPSNKGQLTEKSYRL